MKNKKFLMSMLSVCFLASCAFGVACKDDGAGDSSSGFTSSVEDSTSDDSSNVLQTKASIKLSNSFVNMQVYDKATLTATVKETDEKVSWKTSDASVVTVDGGKLYAVKEGKAVITATVENVSATCEVTVSAPTSAPVLDFANDVYVNVKGVFESEIRATWKGEAIPEDVSYSVQLVGERGIAGLTLDNANDTFKVTGIKAGTTTYRIYTTIRDVYVSKDVTITVYATDNSIVANNSAFRPQNGAYSVTLATVDVGEHVHTTALDFAVYEKGKEVVDADIIWKTEASNYDASVVTVEDGKLKATGAGETTLVGVYKKGGAEIASVTLNVSVYKPQLTLENESRKMLEVADLQAFEVESELIGTIVDAEFHGENVFKSVSGKSVSLYASKMPKKHELLGDQYLQVITDKVIYDVPVKVYSMIINSAEELDQLAEASVILNESGQSSGVHDGYFILGDNISYNKDFIPFLSQDQIYVSNGNKISYDFNVYGWRGIFDGCGYNIDGLNVGAGKAGDAFVDNSLIVETGVFGIIHRDGVVKNVSFTNAGVHENAGFIASGGSGLIENVHVSYKNFGVGAPNWTSTADGTSPRIMGTFYPARVGETALVRNCVVDIASAIIAKDPNEKNYKFSSVRAVGVPSVMDGVILICGDSQIQSNSGANFVFDSYTAFVEDITINSIYDEWDQEFWTRVNGIPMAKKYATEVLNTDEEVSISAKDIAFVGVNNEITVGGRYTKVEIVDEPAGVSYKDGILTVTQEAIGTSVTLKVSTYLNESTAEISVDVKGVAERDVAQAEKILIDCVSTSLDLTAGSAYNGAKATVIYDGAVLCEGDIVNNTISVDLSSIKATLNSITEATNLKFGIITEKDGTFNKYELEYSYVTKLIASVEDINNYLIVPADKNDPRYTNAIQGYFLLVNDIDYEGAMTAPTGYAKNWTEYTGGFRGVFDGNHKTIKNFVINNTNNDQVKAKGLFGQIGKDAVIKNVTFDNVVYPEGNSAMPLLGGSVRNATLENITVNVLDYHFACETITVDGQTKKVVYRENGLLATRWFYGNVVKNVTINAEGFDLGRLLGRHEKDGTYENFVIKAKSFREISGEAEKWNDKNANGNNDYGEDVMQTELPVGITFVPDADGKAWLDVNPKDGLNDNVTPYVE